MYNYLTTYPLSYNIYWFKFLFLIYNDGMKNDEGGKRLRWNSGVEENLKIKVMAYKQLLSGGRFQTVTEWIAAANNC